MNINQEQVIIRYATIDDARQIAEIIVEDWKIAYKGIIDSDFLDSMNVEERYQRELQRYQIYKVAEINGEILGLTWNEFADNEDSDCEIIALYIKCGKRKSGIGRIMFHDSVEQFKAAGKSKMIIWCLKENYEARKFYDFLHDGLGVSKVRFPETSAFGVKPVSREGSERLIRAAIEYALSHDLPSVTIVHKGNIMKYTEGAFKKWGYELAEKEFGDELRSGRLVIKDCICDAFLQNALLRPQDYSVIATLNLNGDYVSDMLAAQVGGIGIAPGANINYSTGHAIFEATHGIAPDIAGKDIVNPSSIILSAVMMLDYIGWGDAGKLIHQALEKLFLQGVATYDLARFMDKGKALSTSEFGNELIKVL